MHALNWGATDGDMTRVMAGDAAVPHPNHENTMAVEVRGEPHHIWPWLLQMGSGRGGLYSYDWITRLLGYVDRPSADHVLTEYQSLHRGDVIPLGRGGGMPVLTVDPERALVLGRTTGEIQWVWEFGLYPIGRRRTRLVSRSRMHVPATWRWRLLMMVLAPVAFLMIRRLMLGLQQRAERLARA